MSYLYKMQKLREKKEEREKEFPIWAIVLISVIGFLIVVSVMVYVFYQIDDNEPSRSLKKMDKVPTQHGSKEEICKKAEDLVGKKNVILKKTKAGAYFLGDESHPSTFYVYRNDAWTTVPNKNFDPYFNDVAKTRKVSC